jgi:Ca-activated chloride channel family protein
MTITTIGLGLDYDEDLMTSLASESGGNAYFAKTADRLADIFKRDMEDAVALTGRHTRVTLSCDGGAKPVQTIGRDGIVKGNVITADIDNLYGAEKYAIFELEVPASEGEATLRLGTVKVEYTDAVTGSTVILASPLEIEYTKNSDTVNKNRSVEITSQVEMAKNAEIRERVIRLSDEGRAKEAAAILRERADYLEAERDNLSPMAVAAAPSFGFLAEEISSHGEMSSEQRKTNMNIAYAAKNQQADVETETSPDIDEER